MPSLLQTGPPRVAKVLGFHHAALWERPGPGTAGSCLSISALHPRQLHREAGEGLEKQEAPQGQAQVGRPLLGAGVRPYLYLDE